MARPSKPIALVKGHRTKAEIETRKKAENSLVTNKKMKEWTETKDDPVAHKHFLKINRLFKAIEKNDALNEPTINRYCLMLSECQKYEEEDKRLKRLMDELEENWEEKNMEFDQYIKTTLKINKQIQANDRLLMSKRRMLLDIEKESIMTIASQLRSIPKKPEEKKKSEMAAFLAKRSGSSG